MMKRSSKVIALALGLILALSTVSAFAATPSGGGIDISKGKVTVTTSSKTYNGYKGTAGVQVVVNNTVLKKGTDYVVAGATTPSALAKTYTLGNIEIVGVGAYKGTLFTSTDYTIKKAYQKPTVTPSKKTVYYSKLKKRTQYVTMKTTGNKGAVTYSKSSGSKNLTVNKYGKISVKKGTRKGTYSIKVKVYCKYVGYKYYSKTLYKTVKVVVK